VSYAVFHISDDSQTGWGLSLVEAFTRVMALAECDYIFHRVDGVMHLELHHRDPVPECECQQDDAELRTRYYPDHRSMLVDDAMARADIMRQFLLAGFKGYHVVNQFDGARGTLNAAVLREIEHAIDRV
jgi:hypothetical protein